jgi:DNA-binding transcriptional regulator LsrR (DeoR family)
LQLPQNFYRNEDVKDYHRAFFKNFIEQVKQCHIFIIGIGMPKDIKDIYKIITNRSIREEDFVAESNDIPFNKDGTQDKTMAEKAIGLNIDDFRELRKSSDKHVVAVAGGCKRNAVEYSIYNKKGPHFNTIVTDTEIADYLLDRSKRKSSA